MFLLINCNQISKARRLVIRQLLEARGQEVYWVGHLSSSPLATATAITALFLAQRSGLVKDPAATAQIQKGLKWLLATQNEDGGWGDTPKSLSNLTTTLICYSTLKLLKSSFAEAACPQVNERLERRLLMWLKSLEPTQLIAEVLKCYGQDKASFVPIITHAAICGSLGQEPYCWAAVPQLPFELAILPHRVYKWIRLPVVSYALPALIAFGLAKFANDLRGGFSVTRRVRKVARTFALKRLQGIQPSDGGFLEAIPLTSLVAMSLIAAKESEHPVTKNCIRFLVNSQREDGSWAIATNLATWLTTLSIQAIGSDCRTFLQPNEQNSLRNWLLKQQFKQQHPYTGSLPGGWAWTDLPGGVPDADDTSSALIALFYLERKSPVVQQAAAAGIHWLCMLQNKDGGIPTFCKGPGHLHFDRSSPDITAHAIRAWLCWRQFLPPQYWPKLAKSLDRAVRFLIDMQQSDGSWLPLWFGNQFQADLCNRTYGTARVLTALSALHQNNAEVSKAIARGCHYLVDIQKDSGGWSGGPDGEASIEETAIAIEALATVLRCNLQFPQSQRHKITAALELGLNYLLQQIEANTWKVPSPIGLYLAKLWYYENLYPIIFTAFALTAVERLVSSQSAP